MNGWLEWLVFDAGSVELRRQTATGWRSRWYSCSDALHNGVQALPAGVQAYTTLNRPHEQHRHIGALRDADVAVIKRIVFDFDPARPKGVPSSEQELAGAVAVRDELVSLLSVHGWPAPAVGISGNGAHAAYRCNIVNEPGWSEVTARLYVGLRNRLAASCKRSGVTFDTSVRNPARIWRIYGRPNTKGAACSERPHRRAEIHVPLSGWQPVKASVVNRTVDAVTPVVDESRRESGPVERPAGTGDYRTLDVVGWFTARNAYRRALGGGKHAVRCPWEHEHTTDAGERDSSTVIFETHSEMWPNFHCSHAHCEGRGIRDVLAVWDDADAYCAEEWRARHG